MIAIRIQKDPNYLADLVSEFWFLIQIVDRKITKIQKPTLKKSCLDLYS